MTYKENVFVVLILLFLETFIFEGLPWVSFVLIMLYNILRTKYPVYTYYDRAVVLHMLVNIITLFFILSSVVYSVTSLTSTLCMDGPQPLSKGVCKGKSEEIQACSDFLDRAESRANQVQSIADKVQSASTSSIGRAVSRANPVGTLVGGLTLGLSEVASSAATNVTHNVDTLRQLVDDATEDLSFQRMVETNAWKDQIPSDSSESESESESDSEIPLDKPIKLTCVIL